MSTWPQWTLLAWWGFVTIFGVAGRIEKAQVGLTFATIGVGVGEMACLYYGGFFAPLGWHP